MLILLTQETTEVSPVVLILFVVAVIGLTFLSMRKTSDSTVALIKKRYEGQILGECICKVDVYTQFPCYAFVTKDEFVIQKNQNCFLAFPLANIAYVQAFRDMATKQWALALWDKDKKQKGLDGKMISGAQNTKKYKGTSLLPMQKDSADELCEFIVKYASHIQILQK